MTPLVSICIPTYNGEAYLAEALQSALAQTYPNLEIVISDDASTDGTLEIVETFKNKTAIPIRLFYHEPNGIGANWNNCIKYAQGEYIKFLFQDDVLEPTCVEKMVSVLEGDVSIGLVASKRHFIVEKDFNNKQTQIWIENYGDLQKHLVLKKEEGYSIIDTTLFRFEGFLKSPMNYVGEPSVFMFRTSLINKVGDFREDLKQILDFEFCYRVLKKQKIAIIEEKLVKFRLHHLQTTQANIGNDKNDYTIYKTIIYKEYFWYLNNETRWELLRKFNPYVRFYLRLKRRITKLIK